MDADVAMGHVNAMYIYTNTTCVENMKQRPTITTTAAGGVP
jgi:hypothetical protein